MRTILLLAVCVTVLNSGFASGAENEPSLVWTAQILAVEQTPEALRFVIKSGKPEDHWNLTIRIPKGDVQRWPAAPQSFKFAAFVESMDADTKQAMDKALTKKFGRGEPQTIFKPRGYVAASASAPIELAKKGGALLLVDPAIDGGLTWTIRVHLDLSDHAASIEIGKASG